MISDDVKQTLIKRAVVAQHHAYVPYSHYAVGAALLTSSGKIYDGANIENAVYPLTLCAERVAIFKAVSEGEIGLDAIAVVTRNGGTPCGSCRQVIREFGKTAIVLIANENGDLLQETTLENLLPDSFGPEDLES
ncbi:MAG: cytidine deaminase [Anaerolineaceae bacterium]|nr:cytidine deaminase [Anaerolineaceae bacterium]